MVYSIYFLKFLTLIQEFLKYISNYFKMLYYLMLKIFELLP